MVRVVSNHAGKMTLLAVLIGPAFLYPCFYGVSVLIDFMAGDGVIIDHFLNVSKRDIWSLFWADWAAALLPSYVLLLPCFVLALTAKRLFGTSLWITMTVSVVAAALLGSVLFLSGNYLIPLLLVSILFAAPASGILYLCSR